METYTGAHILVVDDTSSITALLEVILEEEGYQVTVANNGKTALARTEEFLPDVILLDIMMPGMSGFDVLEELVKNPRTRDIPVLMVTARAELDDVSRALNMGALDYIKKPIETVDLLARVRVALRLKYKEDHLRQLIRLKDQFIAIFSDELRLPILSILEKAESFIARRDFSKSIEEDALMQIHGEASGVIQYFDSLLSILYQNSDLGVLKMRPVPFINICIHTQRLLLSLTQRKNIRFEVDVPRNLKITCDELLLELALRNLSALIMRIVKPDSKVVLKFDGETIQFQFLPSSVGDKELLKNMAKGIASVSDQGAEMALVTKVFAAHGMQIRIEQVEQIRIIVLSDS